MIKTLQPQTIISEIIPENGYFPNNVVYPLLIYKIALNLENEKSPESIQRLLKDNGWYQSWVDNIYDYHHYHSNTHEVLVIYNGEGVVQIGGENGKIYDIEKGDVIIFPAGLAHKSISLSNNFKCVGAYPLDIDYDMNYGKAEEHPQVDINIKHVPLPAQDPIFGKNGLLFDYWKE